MTDTTLVNLDDDSDEAYLAQEALALFAETIATIEDDATFQRVAARLVERREWIARVEAWFKPLAEAAYAAHRAITGRRAAILDGPKKLCEADSKALAVYEAKKRRDVEIAQARAQQEVDMAVEVARREGVALGPVVVAPIATTSPRAPGLTFADQWYAEVVDVKALAKAVGAGTVSEAALEPSMHYLNDLAVQLKGAFNVPGVVAKTRRVTRRT
jgi:hypothetical protein